MVSHILRFCGSATSSRVTSHGPIGPKLSADLPLVHWTAALGLEGALGNVVDQAVAGDVAHGLVFRDVAGLLADDDAEFDFPVESSWTRAG